MKLLVTGGAGFIGSAFVRRTLTDSGDSVVNLDKLTYAGNLQSLTPVADHPGYAFEHADICDRHAVADILRAHKPDAIIHLAAESHVDRSIAAPSEFVQTNVLGTAVLLEEVTRYWQHLDATRRDAFRFLHVSTDEVYGELAPDAAPFTETSSYAPNSPYAASKAGADHLVRAWHRTYGLPVLITNCSNNYGPYQFPEKLIPLMILNALESRPLPVYGDGCQVRDWLYVDDHVDALRAVLARGHVGETYNIGGGNERTNIELVEGICALLEELVPADAPGSGRYAELITHVTDRPGHDRRYAMDARKLQSSIGWSPAHDVASGLRATVSWYLDNRDWIREVAP